MKVPLYYIIIHGVQPP